MTTSTTSTTIIIPGRETQTIPGLVLTTADVIASFAGDIDLSQMTSSETTEGSNVTITFANRTGTKGSEVTVNIEQVNINGDVMVNSTRIEIPGREAQVIPGIVMNQAEVRAAFAGEIELAGMQCTESEEDGVAIISFANKTGTKGQVDILNTILAAVAANAPAVEATAEDIEEDEDEFIEVVNTLISIPGREDQVIPGIVLDAQMVKDSFSGEIDLSGYNVEETENGNTLEVRFTARTGTKGEA